MPTSVESLPPIPLASIPPSAHFYVPVSFAAGWPDPAVRTGYSLGGGVIWSIPSLSHAGEWLSATAGSPRGSALLYTVEGLLRRGHGLDGPHWLFEAEPSGPSLEPFPILQWSDRMAYYRATDARLNRLVTQWSRSSELEFSAACLERAMSSAAKAGYYLSIQHIAATIIHFARQYASAYRLIPDISLSFLDQVRTLPEVSPKHGIDLPDQSSIEAACETAASVAKSAIGFERPFAEAIAQDPITYRKAGFVAERCRLAVQCLRPDLFSMPRDEHEMTSRKAQWTKVWLEELAWQAVLLTSILSP